MQTNNIFISEQLKPDLIHNNFSKYKYIYENRLLKPEIKTGPNLVNHAPIKKFQKSYYKNRNLASNQKISNHDQNFNNINNIHPDLENNPIQILKDFNYQNHHKYHEIDMTTKKIIIKFIIIKIKMVVKLI